MKVITFIVISNMMLINSFKLNLQNIMTSHLINQSLRKEYI